MINRACPGAAPAQRRALSAGLRSSGRRQRRARRARRWLVSLLLTLAQMALPVRVEPGRAQAAPAHRLVLAQAITRVLNLGAAAPVL